MTVDPLRPDLRIGQSKRKAARVSTAGIGIRGAQSRELRGIRNPNSPYLRAQPPAGRVYLRNEKKSLSLAGEKLREISKKKPSAKV